MAAVTHSRYVPPVPDYLPRSTTTLLRLVQLQEIFNSEYPKNKRAKAIETYPMKVKALEEACFNSPQLETLERALETLEWGVADIYKVAQQTTSEKVCACAKLMLKDAYSLVASPVKRSCAGVEGPVFLVEYPRGAKLKAYVIKWTYRNEFCSNRVYDQLSTFFNHPTDGVGFLVPQSTAFDFAKGFRELSNGQVLELTSEERGLLRLNFEALLTQVPPDALREYDDLSYKTKEISLEDRRIVVTERVIGENLLDFSYTKYPSLNQAQKIKLFSRLARLALLDLVVGNLDRFFRVSKEGADYSFQDVGANLGNVMLVLPPGEKAPIVYAIDNTMDSKFLSDPIERAEYHAFLTRIYSDPCFMIDQLVSNMVSCMKLYALPDSFSGSCQENRLKAKKHLDSFNQDIEELGRAAFERGIKEMLNCLQGEAGLISLWHSEKGEPLRSSLQQAYPEFLDSLEARLAIFQSSKKEEAC